MYTRFSAISIEIQTPYDKRLAITSCHKNICDVNKAKEKENENRKSRVKPLNFGQKRTNKRHCENSKKRKEE